MAYKLEKHGFAYPFSWEQIAGYEADPEKRRRGHSETVPLTNEDRAAHARAVAAEAELDSNPWVMHGYEPHEVLPLRPRTVWVHDETEEEWKARVG